MGKGKADAAYYQDRKDNFTLEYPGLVFGGRAFRECDGWSENRASHIYWARVEGFGTIESLHIDPPKGHACGGAVAVRIQLLPPNTPLASEKRALAEAVQRAKHEEQLQAAARAELEKWAEEQRERAKEQKRQRQERLRQQAEQQRRDNEAQLEAEARKAQALSEVQAQARLAEALQKHNLRLKVDKLQRHVHQNRNLFDRDFRLDTVRRFQQEILTQRREAWTREYEELFSQADLIAALRAEAPEVLQWHEHRIDLILLAERLAVAPPDTSGLLKERRITSRTLGQVQRTISELFRLREQIESALEHQAVDGRHDQQEAEQALRNAGRLLQEGGAQAIKLEGGSPVAGVARRLVEAGIPVMGHLGLTPQSVHQLGGFGAVGKTDEEAARILEDARDLQAAGVFAIVLESIPAELARRITGELTTPTIGIGAGPDCDGQVLVSYDAFGLFDRFVPRFVKQYANLGELIVSGAQAYIEDVREGRFPAEQHTIHNAIPKAHR